MDMVVGVKDAIKLLGIMIIVFCAVLVCTMFLNYNLDIVGIGGEITSEPVRLFYEAQVSTAKVVSIVSGGCLLITSAIMLLFYIKNYIDTHKKELGVLKALGYSNIQIAKHFWVFGLSVLIGALIGFCGAYMIMPTFYAVQNVDKILPALSMRFHPSLLLFLVILPSIAFAVLAIFYAYRKLKRPPLELIKENVNATFKLRKNKKSKKGERSFVDELKRNILREKKVLVFFIVFASFCFSAMTQMSFSMNELASVMMGVMIMLIGVVLACTTLFLAITTVVQGNIKTIALMRAFGYAHRECCTALLSAYRPMGYVGFALGTIYQYVLLKVMVSVVFKDIAGVPEYGFDFPIMLLSLASFVLFYEIVLYCYSERMKKISIKEIMLD